MAQYDPSSKEGAKLLKKVREELQKAFLGYCLVYATSDDQFGSGPRIRRNVVNPRIAEEKGLDLFYRATHQGASLDTMNVQHSVAIGVHPRSLSCSLAKDPCKASMILYRSRLHGISYEQEKLIHSRFTHHIPILLDGAHRFDLMQKRVYRDALIELNQAKLHLEAHNKGNSSSQSHHVKKWKARYDAALAIAKEGTWLARVYNMSKYILIFFKLLFKLILSHQK